MKGLAARFASPGQLAYASLRLWAFARLRLAARFACLLIAAGSSACDLERMIDQPSLEPFEGSVFFDDGMGMRRPPDGTVPRRRGLSPPEVSEGARGGAYVEAIPIEIDRARLERGRERYEIFCALCHGYMGDGNSEVGDHMPLRRPPALVRDPIASHPAGRTYRVITQGYGLMPGYAAELTVVDRWSIVAYLGVLRLSQSARLEDLPPSLAAAARRSLP